MRHPGSFRDPSGFIFFRDGEVFRQINAEYRENYAALRSSGLYDELVGRDLLLPHTELGPRDEGADNLVIKPKMLETITYPYEWCFSALKKSALLTLDIQECAIGHEMTLKDASAFNVQLLGSKPVFIDTLSFDKYDGTGAWVAYAQFCRHFLSPLLLASYVDIRLNSLWRSQIDGFPLDLVSRLLPRRTWLRLGVCMHVHLHARSERAFAGRSVPERTKERGLSQKGMLNLIESLRDLVEFCQWDPTGTEWAGYDQDHMYTSTDLKHKTAFIRRVLLATKPRTVWDLGANQGRYSRLAGEAGAQVLAIDIDPGATELHYRNLQARGETNVTPVCIDLSNPTPGLGWASRERSGLAERGPADLGLILALTHHLRVTTNIPFDAMMKGLAEFTKRAVVEFVPKGDPQAQRLMVSRPDSFHDWTREGFETALSESWSVERTFELPDSGRVLYHASARENP